MKSSTYFMTCLSLTLFECVQTQRIKIGSPIHPTTVFTFSIKHNLQLSTENESHSSEKNMQDLQYMQQRQTKRDFLLSHLHLTSKMTFTSSWSQQSVEIIKAIAERKHISQTPNITPKSQNNFLYFPQQKRKSQVSTWFPETRLWRS